jgi:hypothetical protein
MVEVEGKLQPDDVITAFSGLSLFAWSRNLRQSFDRSNPGFVGQGAIARTREAAAPTGSDGHGGFGVDDDGGGLEVVVQRVHR